MKHVTCFLTARHLRHPLIMCQDETPSCAHAHEQTNSAPLLKLVRKQAGGLSLCTTHTHTHTHTYTEKKSFAVVFHGMSSCCKVSLQPEEETRRIVVVVGGGFAFLFDLLLLLLLLLSWFPFLLSDCQVSAQWLGGWSIFTSRDG
jgi:hypothetical protein